MKLCFSRDDRRSDSGFGEVDERSLWSIGAYADVDSALRPAHYSADGGFDSAAHANVTEKIHPGTAGDDSQLNVLTQMTLERESIDDFVDRPITTDRQNRREPQLDCLTGELGGVALVTAAPNLSPHTMPSEESFGSSPAALCSAMAGGGINNGDKALTVLASHPSVLRSVILSYSERHSRGHARLAKQDQQELTEEAVTRITRVVRSLADDQVERGVELARPMHCDSCDREQAPAGSALYGTYKLCNDCLLDFTLQLASGRVANVAEFMTKKTEEPRSLPPSDLAGERDRSTMSVRQLHGRDKLMPSNEPC